MAVFLVNYFRLSYLTVSLVLKIKKFPDPPNQLGFTKGAQTYDHILTLNTIISKYKTIIRNLFRQSFVDFRKAFDSVCREALFYKLSCLGVTGKVFNVLRHMYSSSTGQIKLSLIKAPNRVTLYRQIYLKCIYTYMIFPLN